MSNLPENAAAYNSVTTTSPSLADLPGAFFARAVALIRGWMERSRDRMRLLELDDYMLADIGMTRREAERLVNQPFWRV